MDICAYIHMQACNTHMWACICTYVAHKYIHKHMQAHTDACNTHKHCQYSHAHKSKCIK